MIYENNLKIKKDKGKHLPGAPIMHAPTKTDCTSNATPTNPK